MSKQQGKYFASERIELCTSERVLPVTAGTTNSKMAEDERCMQSYLPFSSILELKLLAVLKHSCNLLSNALTKLSSSRLTCAVRT
jgi:hypothetical protein